MEENIGYSPPASPPALLLDEENRGYLRETARWAKFLAIAGIVFCILFAGIGIVMAAAMPFMDMPGGSSPFTGGMGAAVGIIYVIAAVIYLFPCLYLLRFATNMQSALQQENQQVMTASLRNLKACFRFVGIFTAAILIIYALGIVVFIVVSATR